MAWTSFGGELCSDSCQATRSRHNLKESVGSWHSKNVWKWFVKLHVLCVCYILLCMFTCHMLSQERVRQHIGHVKHIGAWSPGLAPHPGEASPGGRMDQIMKVLERLWNIITCKQRSSRFTTQMHHHALSVYDKCSKNTWTKMSD